MEIFIIAILALLLAGTIIYIIKFNNKPDRSNETLAVLLDRLNNISGKQDDLRHDVDAKLTQTHETNRNQFSETARLLQSISHESNKTIAEVTEKLTKLDETNRQVVNFSAQLQNLQDILKNPKQRGILGEFYLEEILKNALPPANWQMQYQFKDGVIVDAVIFLKDLIIPIDSKFSLENYERLLNAKEPELREKLEKQFRQDIKTRIDETSKYIKPTEGTTNFAFMFIPAEAIYYDLLVNKVGAVKINTRDLLEYATHEKKVIITSPTSFYAYLQTVLQGLRMMSIEESAKIIKDNVEKLGKHLAAYESYVEKLGSTLSTTVNHYNSATKEFKKIDKDVAKITGSENVGELPLIDRPIND